MDPNATLSELREWANQEPANDAEEAAMHAFLNLDEWLRKGGFFPHAWSWGSKGKSE